MVKLYVRRRCGLITLFASVLGFSVAAGTALAAPAALEADFDGNGSVDQADLVKWSEGFTCGDPSYNGSNFLDWQRQLGQSSAPVTLVPEPATLVVWSLLGVAAAGTCVWRQKRAE